MAVISNLAVEPLRQHPDQYLPDAWRFYAANIEEAAALVHQSPARD